MNQENAKSAKNCVIPTRDFLYLLQHVVRRAELITIFSCIITTWAFSELAELLMICSSCQFSNHFTLSLCFKIYASTFVRDLCTLGTKPRFPKKGVYCPRQRFPQKQFWWHNLDRKKKKILSPPVCSGEPCDPLHHLIIVQESGSCAKLVMLLVLCCGISTKETPWTLKIVPAFMSLYPPLAKASPANTRSYQALQMLGKYQGGIGIFTINTGWGRRGQALESWGLNLRTPTYMNMDGAYKL